MGVISITAGGHATMRCSFMVRDVEWLNCPEGLRCHWSDHNLFTQYLKVKLWTEGSAASIEDKSKRRTRPVDGETLFKQLCGHSQMATTPQSLATCKILFCLDYLNLSHSFQHHSVLESITTLLLFV